MKRRMQIALWITLPVFFAVFVVVRTIWLAYLRTLSLAELHLRIFDHAVAVAVGVSGTCVLLTWLIVWVLSKRLTDAALRTENSIQVGRTTRGVERVGETIRRPSGEHSEFVRLLLQHLEARDFAGAPKWLGRDSAGRDILSFIPGDVPPELGTFSADQINAAARLLRAYHDATQDFEALGTNEVVCHGDASPCNCVFRDGLPYAFIDFDAAHVGERSEDVGYAAWLWLDIGNDDWDPVQQGSRLGQFLAAYYGSAFTDAILAVTDAQTDLSARDRTPGSTQEWARRCLQWSKDNRAALETGLASARQTEF